MTNESDQADRAISTGKLNALLRHPAYQRGRLPRLGVHAFRPGEYVSIRDEDGETHTFQVAAVEPAI